MKTLATIISLLLCSPAWAQCKVPSDPVPAPAAAHGFTCEVFSDDFASLATIDLANTRVPGFRWYPEAGYGSVSPASIFTQTGGGLQILPVTNDPQQGLYNMSSCASLGGKQYVGRSVQGGMYVRVKLTTWGPQLGGNNWWPAVWMLSTDQLYNSYPGPFPAYDSPEVDIREWSEAGKDRNLHSWHIFWDGTLVPPGVNQNPSTHTAYALTTAFASGDVMGTLLLKPEQNGGTGKVEGYLNDVVAATSTPVTWAPGATYSNTTESTMCILFGSGFNQPIVIRSIQVWQAPPGPGSHQGWR